MALQKKTAIVALAIAAIIMMASVLALLTSTKTIPSKGTIYAFKVAVYENDTTTPVATPFFFDNVNAGGETYRDIYVKNEAESKSLTLSMTVTDWSATPSNSSDIGVTLAWNHTGGAIAPGNGVNLRLTLTAADNEQTKNGLDFDININIIGTSTT